MMFLYKDFNHTKGLPFFTSEQIEKRNYIKQILIKSVCKILTNINQAWRFEEWEAPLLIPEELIDKNYTTQDYYQTSTLALRPETTASSYKIADYLLNNNYKLPLCVFQAGKSFRKENSEQSMKTHKRFTEFYQLEFQCLYSASSKANYYQAIIDAFPEIIKDLIKLNVRIIESERLPTYSIKTFDIEVETPEKWLEVCSISQRKDFKENVENLEIAFGLDRLILC